jgi:hypothetical protein
MENGRSIGFTEEIHPVVSTESPYVNSSSIGFVRIFATMFASVFATVLHILGFYISSSGSNP